MRHENLTIHLAALLALISAPALSQSPATVVHTSGIGFTYSLPADWEFVEQQPAVAKPDVTPLSSIPDEKRGTGCVQVALTARHGNPSSAIVAVTLPFDCYGQPMTAADLPGFGEGAAAGLKQAFDITALAGSTYILDNHSLWIERATGTAKGQLAPLLSTLEITCTLLQKGAACWMVTAADNEALKTFENAAVTLDGGSAHALVPPEVTTKLANLAQTGGK